MTQSMRNVFAGFGAAAWLACLGCPTTATLPDLGGREVKIAVENAYPPFNDVNPDTGEPEGWDYDAINEIARRLNFVPVYVETPWPQIVDGVAAGTYDLAGNGIAVTYSRSSRVDYSRQYTIVRQRLAVRAGENRVSTLAEFKDNASLLVGAEEASSNLEAAVGYFGTDRVRTYQGLEPMLQALRNGEIDGVAIDDLAYWVQAGGGGNGLSRLPGVLYGNLLAFIFPKGSDLVEPVNQAINAMEQDGTLQSLNDRWFSHTD